MPQAGSLTPPSEATTSLRQSATAPNLRLMNVNRYANLEMDSPVVAGSPPRPGRGSLGPMFYPLPGSKYRQLSQVSLSQLSNFSTSPPKIQADFAQKPSFTVGPQDEADSRSGCCSRADSTVPTMSLQSYDTPVATPRGTPMGSPQLMRKRSIPDIADSRPSGGFLGWLTRSSVPVMPQQSEFFHQKEDMHSLQSTGKSQSFKSRPKMPVSLADINVFTPSEY